MITYTLEQDIADLMRNTPGTEDKLKEWVAMNLKHCSDKFVKYDNTMDKAMELIAGLYEEDLTVELLIAPTQFGKTSTVFWTAHNLMTHPDPDYFVPYPFVFIMSGLNSNSWKEQTKARVLPCMVENVWHNKDISKPDNAARLKEAVLSDYNTLIVIDEIHIGSKLNHVIFNTLRDFHPENADREISQLDLFEFLHTKRVKFLLVSATPDAVKETLEMNWGDNKFKTVKAHPDTAPSYVWHKDFLTTGRVHQAYGMKDKTEDGIVFHEVIAQRISEYARPMYHMIRFPMDTKTADITMSKDLLTKSIDALGVKANIVMWDAKNSIQDYFASKSYKVFEDTTVTSLDMKKLSNEEILKKNPLVHTVFVIKELFRVAQTMPIDNIGVLVDRDTKTPSDSTLSQSLIGRACGHNKREFINQILIYTHVPAVINYVNLWENDFDYSKVPGYKGAGIKGNKRGTKIVVDETMMGDKVERNITWTDHEPTEPEGQEDTEERLAKVARAYKKTNTIVHRIIKMFIANGFDAINEKELAAVAKNGKICMKHYNSWDSTHARYNIVVKVNDMWIIREEIKSYLQL